VPIYAYRGVRPSLGEGAFMAPGAVVVGDVQLGDRVSFWFHTVARGDVNWIRIGERTNIQDGAVLHVTHEEFPLMIGSGVVVGHSAMLHGCTVESGALIGIGARVLDGAVVESGAQVGAGAVVAPGHRVPLTEEESSRIPAIVERYVRLAGEYRALLGAGTGGGVA
jgi:carbonic anhydrase/acetyltransferase-like protein (isoleucine patch superfamily)